MAGHEDEETREGRYCDKCHGKFHERPLVEKCADVRLADTREGHEGVFTEPKESKDWVQCILVGHEEVDADCEWEDDLLLLALYNVNARKVLTQQRVALDLSKKIRMKAVQKAPNNEVSPMIIRRVIEVGTRLPKAFMRRKPGNASRSMAWKT